MKEDVNKRLKFMRITHNPISAVWAKQVNCPNISCNWNFSEAVASKDGSKIYAFMTYGNPIETILFTLDANTGNAVGEKYRVSQAFWIAMHVHNEHVYITLRSSIIVYNTVTNIFKQYKTLAVNAWIIVDDPNSNR